MPHVGAPLGRCAAGSAISPAYPRSSHSRRKRELGMVGGRRDAAQIEAERAARFALDRRADESSSAGDSSQAAPAARAMACVATAATQLPQHVRQDPAVAERDELLRRVDARDRRESRGRCRRRRCARTVTSPRGLQRLRRRRRCRSARVRSARATPRSRRRWNCSGSTPMFTRLLRWMRSKLSAITALHAEQQRALRRPVARRSRPVLLAGDDRSAARRASWYFIAAS